MKRFFPLPTDDLVAFYAVPTQMAVDEDSRTEYGGLSIRCRHVLVAMTTVAGYWQEILNSHGVTEDRVRATLKLSIAANFKCDEDQPMVMLSNLAVRRLKHNRTDPGHVLLGLLRWPRGPFVQILKHLNVDLEALEADIEARLPPAEFPVYDALKRFRESSFVVEILARQERIWNEFRKAGYPQEQHAAVRSEATQTRLDLEATLERLWKTQAGDKSL